MKKAMTTILIILGIFVLVGLAEIVSRVVNKRVEEANRVNRVCGIIDSITHNFAEPAIGYEAIITLSEYPGIEFKTTKNIDLYVAVGQKACFPKV